MAQNGKETVKFSTAAGRARCPDPESRSGRDCVGPCQCAVAPRPAATKFKFRCLLVRFGAFWCTLSERVRSTDAVKFNFRSSEVIGSHRKSFLAGGKTKKRSHFGPIWLRLGRVTLGPRPWILGPQLFITSSFFDIKKG